MARKVRNIYRRKDGRYEARYIKDRDDQGKAIYGAVYARSYAEVKEKLELAKKLNKPAVPANAVRTITAELETHLETLKPQIKQSTYGVYRRYIDDYIYPFFKDMPCSHLIAEVSQKFVNRQLENGLSAATVQSVFCFLKNGLKSTLATDVFCVKLPKSTSSEVKVLTVDEQKRLESVAKASDHINCISIILCLYTGIRIGELCGLLWSDIDFEHKQLHIRRTLQRIRSLDGNTKTVVITTSPKSNASNRCIPLPEFLIDLLKEHHIHASGKHVISRNGNAIEPRNIQYRFKNLLSDADIKPANFHSTRHTFATRALENGFDVKTLSEILGHASPALTLKKYAHSLDEHKRKSMESLSVIYTPLEI